MLYHILITAFFIIIGFLLIKSANQGYPPLMEIWQASLIRKIAGDRGLIIFYYICGISIMLMAIARLIYLSMNN